MNGSSGEAPVRRRLHVSVLRLGLAAVLLATATGKLLDIRGFAAIVATYRVLPEALAFPAGLALALTELGLSAWLASGVRLRWAALAAVVLHLGFFVWSSIALARGLDLPNCGCFGVFWARPLNWQALAEDAALITWAGFLYLGASKPGRSRVDGTESSS